MKTHSIKNVGTVYSVYNLEGRYYELFDSNKHYIGAIDTEQFYDILSKIKNFQEFDCFINFFFVEKNDYAYWQYGTKAREKVIDYINKHICVSEERTEELKKRLNDFYIIQVGNYCFTLNTSYIIKTFSKDYGNFRPIELDKMYGTFYIESKEGYYALFDEQKEIIAEYETDLDMDFDTIKNMCNIDDLVTYGYVDNIVWGSTLTELYEEVLDRYGYSEEELDLADFIEEFNINSIGRGSIYFIVNLD